MMFATPVIYPLSAMKPQYQWIIKLNPVTAIVESFRYGFMGAGNFEWIQLGYSSLVTCVLLLLGILIFNKVEKSFMDTV
jgi:lipopolysaccharide transport system permease protein